MAAAGLPDTREFKFHAIRKSHASHKAAAGVDPQHALGHADGRTTRRHYIDPRIASNERRDLGKLFRPGATGRAT